MKARTEAPARTKGEAPPPDTLPANGLNGSGTAPELLELLHALQAMRTGDFSVRMRGDHVGIAGKIADTFNDIVSANQRIAQQLEHIGQVPELVARLDAE